MQAWVIGNWKQNPATSHDVKALLDDLLTAVSREEQPDNAHCQLMVAPSLIHLTAVSERLKGSSILSAAQDISAYSPSTGAYICRGSFAC